MPAIREVDAGADDRERRRRRRGRPARARPEGACAGSSTIASTPPRGRRRRARARGPMRSTTMRARSSRTSGWGSQMSTRATSSPSVRGRSNVGCIWYGSGMKRSRDPRGRRRPRHPRPRPRAARARRATTSPRPRAARQACAQFYATPPDLVLLDVSMPELDGWQTLERIRDLSDVPVMMLTARAGELEKVRGLKGGRGRLRDEALRPPGAARARRGAAAARGPREATSRRPTRDALVDDRLRPARGRRRRRTRSR